MHADQIVTALIAALAADPPAHAWAVRNRALLIEVVREEQTAQAQTSNERVRRLIAAMTPDVGDAFRAQSLSPVERMTIRSVVTGAQQAAKGTSYHGMQASGARLSAALAQQDPDAVRFVAETVDNALRRVGSGEAPNVDVAWAALTTYGH